MTTKFAVLGLKSSDVLTSAYLTSNGVRTEEAYALLGSWQGDRDTYQDALIYAQEIAPQFREGVTILPIIFAEEKPQANKGKISLLDPPELNPRRRKYKL